MRDSYTTSVNVYLVHDADGYVLIDTGLATDESKEGVPRWPCCTRYNSRFDPHASLTSSSSTKTGLASRVEDETVKFASKS